MSRSTEMKTHVANAGARDVSAYIAKAPKPAQAMLRQLRVTIKYAAPEAEEKISYGIPYYAYHGRLIYFAAFKHHVGLYVMGAAKRRFARELKEYRTSLSTLRFPIGTPIPVALVKKLVRARVEENEANAKSNK